MVGGGRCGMVWVDPKNLGYRPFFQRWLVMNVKDDPERVARLEELFSKYVPELVDWMMLVRAKKGRAREC